MSNEEFLLGCLHEIALFCTTVNGSRVPVHNVSIHAFPKRVLVVSFSFFPLTDWDLIRNSKMGLSIPHYFEKLFLLLNFSCFEAHSFPMAVLAHTVHCVTVGRYKNV